MEHRGTVLYDGECGFCSRWVPYWADTLRRSGFGVASLQDPRYSRGLDLSSPDSWDLTLLLPDGRRIFGADAYRYVMRRIWWAYPLYTLAIIPGVRGIFNYGYRRFAQNRYCISRALGLENRH